MRSRSFPDLDAPVVIIEGDNEAGKSTFFHFLQTMLYGIYPVSEDKHPYAPRDDLRMEGSLTMESDDGGQYTVMRRLHSAPAGKLEEPDGRSETLGNRDAPLMHISKDVYKAMYALSLYDLALKDKDQAWQAVQDRLVGGVSVDFIRPAREIVEEIEGEASALWRRDKRGKPESKKIGDWLVALHQKIREAKKRDQELRNLSDQVAQYVQHDRGLSEERTKLRTEKRRIEQLAPIRERLRQIDDARRKAGDSSELIGIPDDPAAALGEIAREIGEAEKQRKQLESEREDAERILAAAEAGKGFDMDIRSGNRYDSLLRDRKRAEDDLERAQGQLAEKARRILTAAWDDRFADILAGIAPAALRERIKAFEEARRQVETSQYKEEVHLNTAAPRKSWRGGCMMSLLLLMAAIGAVWFLLLPLAIVLGIASLIATIVTIYRWAQGKHVALSPASSFAPDPSLKEIEAEADRRRDEVHALLDGLPVPESRLNRPDMTLVSELISLQDAVQARQDAQKRMSERMAELQKTAQREQDRIEEQSGDLEKEYTLLKTQQSELEARLRAVGGDDLEQGIAIAATRKKEHRLAQSLEEKLKTDFSGEDVTKVREEIATPEGEGAAWVVSDEEAVEIDKRLNELDAEINTVTEKRIGAKKDIEHLLDPPTLDILQSEREQLESELEVVKERHDRLRLLQHIVREADRRFREAHQPDVLRRASKYVQTITGGRYERFDYDEDEKLRVYEAGNTRRPWPVGTPLSQGTLDQMYLAVRFAFVDHLDEGKESLPVFLDEVFVNWDRGRRTRCYDIFSEAAARRQVFVFTCHPWLAEEMEQALSAKRIPL